MSLEYELLGFFVVVSQCSHPVLNTQHNDTWVDVDLAV